MPKCEVNYFFFIRESILSTISSVALRIAIDFAFFSISLMRSGFLRSSFTTSVSLYAVRSFYSIITEAS